MRWFEAGSFLLLCWIAFAGHADDAEADLKALQGTWQLTGLLAEGDPSLGKGRINEVNLTVTMDKLVMDGLSGKREFSIKLDPSQKPKAIDITPLDGPFKGKTTPGIYEVSGDTFKLCMANQEIKARPKDLSRPKKDRWLSSS
jgi:uncharacterized protein (TIGR03067 family)